MLEKLLSFKNHTLAAFIPWIFFGIFYSNNGHAILFSSLGALVLMGLFNFKELAKGFILPWGSVILFAFLALNEWSGLIAFSDIGTYRLINSALAVIVIFSMIVGKPFTLQYAREEVDSSHWHSPIFIKINWILTVIWAVLMVIMALPSYLLSYEQIHQSWFWTYGLMIVCIVVGIQCNKRLPKFLR